MSNSVKTFWLVLPLIFTASSAFAQSNQDFDDTKFCIYNNGLYSLGAMIEVGDAMLECRFVPSTVEGVSAGAQWVRL